MRWGVVVLVLLAGPAAAECFTGQPKRVTYSTGQVMEVLEREGDLVTYRWPDKAGGGQVQTSRMMLFSGEVRDGDKVRRDTWKGRLPGVADLVPGYEFDVAGMTEYASGNRAETRLQGKVMPAASVTVGNCAYETLVIEERYSVGGEWMFSTTTYLRPDMMVVLRSEIFTSGGEPIDRIATAIE